ncbi:asparaginase domain-containing protein [Hoeflea sp. TYP-13]|uniref:asparaginase domain-containing protein n=1 Tax=Hoeflea sp. TYP-13 TaxID=3230023 RepID=UPI0034C6AD62
MSNSSMQLERSLYRSSTLSVAVVMTGGTIAKSYNPAKARLYNFETKVRDIIASLRTDDLHFDYCDLMHRDSLDIGPLERRAIVDAVAKAAELHDAVLVTHGTDSMAETGEELCRTIGRPDVPVVFTGAMIPGTIAGSDAVQNVTEALLALRLLPPGAYVVFHNRILALPGASKDHNRLTFY